MSNSKVYLSLDVGEKRIGVAKADSQVRLAFPFAVVDVDGKEIENIRHLVEKENASLVVVGYPRNQSGEATAQTAYVTGFVGKLLLTVPVQYQDESVTSIFAEDRLKAQGKPYTKGDIDMQAASMILQDYLEMRRD